MKVLRQSGSKSGDERGHYLREHGWREEHRLLPRAALLPYAACCLPQREMPGGA